VSEEALRPEDLVAWLAGGEKPRERWRVGTEHEKIGVYQDGFDRVPYDGPRGIRAVLEAVAAADAWKPVHEEGHLIALEKDGASITLEPGGQIELSGAPLRTARETCSEFNTHVDLVKRVSEEMGIAWLGLGSDPFHAVDEIPAVPKTRYAIMRRYLPTRGPLAMEMMHATATVQANFDYADPSDMARKMRTSLALSPVVSAIFANSSLSRGRPNGFVSRRVEIWRHTDPDRTGLLPFVFDPDFGYRRYVEWALDVPMFFVVRDHRYLPARGLTFRRFLEEGLEGHRATLADWDMHLTTLFPEVRLKRFIEVRGADAVPRDLTCALPALWKGILYDERAGEDAWRLARDWSSAQREEALRDVARRGLSASVAGRPALERARELTEVAAEGLRRIAERGETDRDERSFLDPIRAQLELGRSPGQVVADEWEGAWERRPERLLEYVRY